MTIEAARLSLQAKALALSGVREAPSRIPESFTAYPVAITYVAQTDGRRHSYSHATKTHVLATEVHIARQDLGRDVETIQPLMDAFVDAVLDDPTLGGAVASIIGESMITARVVNMEWAAQLTFGFRAEITVLITKN